MLDYSETSVVFIAQALNTAQIPCVLWGHCLLRVHGVPTYTGSIDFVIPDDKLHAGETTLAKLNGLLPCPDERTCPASSDERTTPPPATHMHMYTSEVTVALYVQSETLWFLPPFSKSLLPAVNGGKLPAQFVYATDKSILPPWRPGRGSGAFQSGSVTVPKSHILLEAFMRLYARDSEKTIGAFAMAMIAYMEGYVDDDGLLDASLLPPSLAGHYRELREGYKPLMQWTKELKESLGVTEDESDEHSEC